jgi:hypothetical protein
MAHGIERVARWCALFVMVLLPGLAAGQTLFKHPPSGSIYKDFSRAMMTYSLWRVTDPNTQRADAQANLPNATISLTIDDLSGATRAEAIIDLWGGHWGTTGKQIRFNGNSWINIPELDAPPTDGQCYSTSVTMVVDVPLAHLREGSNTFQGTNAGQTCYSFDWGQHGQFGIIVRVYYGSSKAHPTGSITSPTTGSTIGEYPEIAVSASGGAGVNRVDVIGYYNGYDIDGDGIYQDWQYNYHRLKAETGTDIHNHIGTDVSSPYRVSWNTDLVPDQTSGSVKLVARIRDANGVWYVTPEITGITLRRTNASVKMYKASSVPERFAVRSGRDTRTCTINIPSGDNPSSRTSAKVLFTTWNGTNKQALEGETGYLRLGSWTVPKPYGADEHWKFDAVTIPGSVTLAGGNNTFTIYSNSSGFGISMQWPGPAVLVRYGEAPVPIQLAEFTAVPASFGMVQLAWKTISETNNFGFEVERSAGTAENFAVIPNSFIPGQGTTVIPHEYAYIDSGVTPGVWFYRLKQTDLDGTVNYTEPREVKVEAVTGVADGTLPKEFELEQNSPNPFNPSTSIGFSIPVAGFVSLKVYSSLGAEIATIVEGVRVAGRHQVTFNAAGLPSGVYFYRLQALGVSATKKLMLIR